MEESSKRRGKREGRERKKFIIWHFHAFSHIFTHFCGVNNELVGSV